MSHLEVRELFDRPPDHVCVYRELEIAYYSRGGLSAKNPNARSLSASAQSKEEIAWWYDAVQLLFNKEGKLIAFAWNGEGLVIKTMEGQFPGGSLQALDDEVLQKLTETQTPATSTSGQSGRKMADDQAA